MTFFYLLATTIYLFTQKYFHNNVEFSTDNAFSLFTFFYFVLMFVFTIKLIEKLFRKNTYPSFAVETIAIFSFIGSIFAEFIFILDFHFFDSYFYGFSLQKIAVISLLILSFIGLTISFSSIVINQFCRRKLKRKQFLLTSLLFVLFGIYCIVTVVTKTDNKIDENSTEKFDYIVVLGTAVGKEGNPLKILKSRLDRAYQLWQNGISLKILLTGSNAPGEISEAKAGYEYLTKLGIPKEVLEFEEQTTSTFEQIQFLKKYFHNKKLCVVSNEFHLKRVVEMANFYNLNISVSSSKSNFSFEKESYLLFRESAAIGLFILFGI
jgi:vancomycin permeability regulator SanA